MDLSERLTADVGTHYMPGLQALVRFPLEQARRDKAAGLRIGTFISGYPGSPLAGYDLALSRIPKLLEEHDVSFVPAGNEELAATAHMGTQMLDDHPHSKWDGVTSIWYGKGPGVDRSGDALKHGNFAGTSKHGAVVILSGEDHEATSSTMPYQEDYAFESAGIPILYPSTVAEFRDFGLHAIRMSRYSGCWTALKLTSALCDSGQSVTFTEGDVPVKIPDLVIDSVPFAKRTDFSFFPGKNIETERQLYQERHLAVRAYARENSLDVITTAGENDRVGIITAGKSFADVQQAFLDLNVTDDDLHAAGIRVLKLGLIYPMDGEVIRRFASGLDRIIVIEEKRDFIEQQVRSVLQQIGRKIDVVGKRDLGEHPVFPIQGAMDADLIGSRLALLLDDVMSGLNAHARVTELARIQERKYGEIKNRTPNFCSGCPHSSSTVLAPGQEAWGSPGCNCFSTVIEQPERHIDVMTQYGGEGLPWIGLSRFTDREHMVQHIGDGSIYHSSYLNIRWAVATGVNITFKLLYNGVVANTGAQQAVGARTLADLTRGLESEGVKRIVIVTKEPKRYKRARLAPGVEIRQAHRMVETSAELATIPGCTVMVYDESCANERRRQQKRGKIERPDRYVLVNEAVCENCGDCGAKSNCMSLQKVPTEFGDKTRIHTSSCNQDYSCIKGDCPAFTTVVAEHGTGYKLPVPPVVDASTLPDPEIAGLLQSEPFHVYMPGVGGTGVITLNGILSVAAMLDGHGVRSYDQTGAAQKWGPVLSSLAIVPQGTAQFTNKTGKGHADLYLALDEVGAAAASNLDRCAPDRTRAVVNSDLFPTGEQIRDIDVSVDTDGMRDAIASFTASQVEVRARWIAEELFGDYMVTNIVALGTAYQAGVLPISARAIEKAIEINGVAVNVNQQAFRYGRLWIHDRDRVLALVSPPILTADEEQRHRSEALSSRRNRTYLELFSKVGQFSEETRRLLAVRLAELVDYSRAAYAREYLDIVLHVASREREVMGSEGALTDAVVRYLFKVMAYKDEYEVARLYLKPDFSAHVNDTFAKPKKLIYNLQPPLARRLGRKEKVHLGPWFNPAFQILRASRNLRGTHLDPFSYQDSRREERAIVDWYRGLLEQVEKELSSANYQVAVLIAELPNDIRGYEAIKHRNAVVAYERAEGLLERLHRPLLPLLGNR